jgi:hypothetical protein
MIRDILRKPWIWSFVAAFAVWPRPWPHRGKAEADDRRVTFAPSSSSAWLMFVFTLGLQ